MGFWVRTADANGVRVVGSEVLLQPGPTGIDYQMEPAGTLVETADGNVIHQQPTKDNRRRQWVWNGYPATQEGYVRIWPLLESLRSRFRKEMGLSPYVYLKEDVRGLFQRRIQTTDSGSGSGFSFTTTNSYTTNQLKGGHIVISGQARGILSNTATTLSIGDAWNGAVSGSCVISYWEASWFRVRVLEVSRRPFGGRRLAYEESRIVFTVRDPQWNALG